MCYKLLKEYLLFKKNEDEYTSSEKEKILNSIKQELQSKNTTITL